MVDYREILRLQSLGHNTSWKIWDTGTMEARHISCLKSFSIMAEIPWNSATILSKYKSL